MSAKMRRISFRKLTNNVRTCLFLCLFYSFCRVTEMVMSMQPMACVYDVSPSCVVFLVFLVFFKYLCRNYLG